jgi:hypothetical protein
VDWFSPTNRFFTWVATLYQTWLAPGDATTRPTPRLQDPSPELSRTLRDWHASVMVDRGADAVAPYKTQLTFYVREHDRIEVMATFRFENDS